MFCASVVYPFDSESFDFEYFRSRHVPMFTEFLGENCQRFEVHRGLATPGAPPPPFAGYDDAFPDPRDGGCPGPVPAPLPSRGPIAAAC